MGELRARLWSEIETMEIVAGFLAGVNPSHTATRLLKIKMRMDREEAEELYQERLRALSELCQRRN